MAKQTVEIIREAEKKAGEKIEAAKLSAKKTVINAQGKRELILNDARREVKTYEQNKAFSAAQDIKAHYDAAEAQADALCGELDNLANQNREAAIDAAVSILL